MRVAPPRSDSFASDSLLYLSIGQEVLYGPQSVKAVVVKVDAVTKQIVLDIKPDVWISASEQRRLITTSGGDGTKTPMDTKSSVGAKGPAGAKSPTGPMPTATRRKGRLSSKVVDLDENRQRQIVLLRGLLEPDKVQELNDLSCKAYAQFDTNRNGLLDEDELEGLCNQMHKTLGLPLPEKEWVQVLFHKFDINDDGFIDMEEFKALFLRLIKRMLSDFCVVDVRELMPETHGTQNDFEARYDSPTLLGCGAQGTAYMATERCTGQLVVVKKPHQGADRDDFDHLRDKSHPCIVRVFELFIVDRKLNLIVFEHASGGDLSAVSRNCQKTFGHIPTIFAASCTQQTMSGVLYIHRTFKEVHNDLKPENVLLVRHPRSPTDLPRCMVADFGCASSGGGKATGDPRYQAPEIWVNGSCARRSGDVWALGVMLYELLSGGMLVFTGHQNIPGYKEFVQCQNPNLYMLLREGIMDANTEPDWSKLEVGEKAVDLCRQLLTRSVDRRAKLKTAVHHEWFQTILLVEPPLTAELVERLKRRATLSELKVCILNNIAVRLQGDHLEELAHIWRFFDVKLNGAITKEHFVRPLVESGIDPSTADLLFAMGDASADGEVNFNEFVALTFDAAQLTEKQIGGHFLLVFPEAEKNNGVLSIDGLAAKFPNFGRKAVENLFEEMDGCKRGSVDVTSFKEFLMRLN